MMSRIVAMLAIATTCSAGQVCSGPACQLKNQFVQQKVVVQKVVQQPIAQQVVHQQAVVHEVCATPVQYQQVQVAFVPSQVSINGQYTVYDQSHLPPSGVGYSYQGPSQNSLPPDPANDLASRMQTMELKVDTLIEAMASQQALKVRTDSPKQQSAPSKSWSKPQTKSSFFDLDRLRAMSGSDVEPSMKSIDPSSSAATIIMNKCSRCHEDGSENTAFVTPDGTIKSTLPRFDMYERCTLPESDPLHMPKGAPSLTDQELEILRSWVNDGLGGLDY